jgi:hypothetical protein
MLMHAGGGGLFTFNSCLVYISAVWGINMHIRTADTNYLFLLLPTSKSYHNARTFILSERGHSLPYVILYA